jgi:pimeloyl-ACP methyl ester carboxylesterase
MNETMNTGTPYTDNPLMEGFTENYFTTKDNVKLRYLHKGSGMPFILIHGGIDNGDTFLLNAPAYAQAYSVYVPDLRGHGHSVASHGMRISRLGADLHEFIEALDVPKVNLLGWSMGCSVIWSYIDLFGQDKINKVIFDDEPPVLVANSWYTHEEVLKCGGNQMDFWYFYNTILNAGCEWSEDAELSRAFAACFQRGVLMWSLDDMKAMPDNYLEKISLRPQPPKTDNLFQATLLKDHLLIDWRDLFHTITVPVLLTTGDVTHAATVECAEWMSKTMKNCTWVRFSAEEFGNHDFIQTCYRKFNQVVLDFLKEQ